MKKVNNTMKMKQFKKMHKKKELCWDVICIGVMLITLVVAEISVWKYLPDENKLVVMLFTSLVVVWLFLSIVRPFDSYLHRTVLKEYWIEDHGDVIKLFGSVRLIDMNYAYRDILSVKPGFKIVDNAYEKYGCTLAAIKATKSEIEAKSYLEGMGIPVNSIG